MCMISTVNEWDPLEACVVGTATHANWPTTDPVFAEEGQRTLWKDSPIPSGPVPQFIIDQANRELDTLSETLLRLGVTVYRPQPMNFVETQGLYNYCPRDRLLVWNDIIVDVNMMYPCRDQEIQNYSRLLAQARQVVTMPRDQGLVLDAANVCRLGDTWLFLESASGNRAAYDWLCRTLPDVDIELCNFYAGVHIDSTIVALNTDQFVVNGSRLDRNRKNLPRHLKGKEIFFVNEVVAQGFYQYPYASKWIGLNMLSIDPRTVIVDAKQEAMIQALEQGMGMTVIPLELRHSRTLGGGFHCVTLDLVRN